MNGGTMFELIKKRWVKVVTKEMIAYVIVGVLTTLVNLVSFNLLCNRMGIHHMVANIIAWILAVTFAYITNNFFVFGSGIEERNKEVQKIIKFFSARLVTLGIEELGLLIFVTGLGCNNMIVKYALAVIVIIINYIFSKLYIFNKKDNKDNEVNE